MARSSLLFIFFFVALALANDMTDEELEVLNKTPDELWEIYKERYNKVYQNEEEEEYRKGIVIQKYGKLKEELELRNKDLITHTISISKYSDLSNKEFMEKMFGPDSEKKAKYFKLSELMAKSLSSNISLNSVLLIGIAVILNI